MVGEKALLVFIFHWTYLKQGYNNFKFSTYIIHEKLWSLQVLKTYDEQF